MRPSVPCGPGGMPMDGQPPGIQCSSPLPLPPQTPTQMHPNQSTPPSMDPPNQPPGAQPTQNQSHQSPSSDQMNTNNASNNETASQSNDGSFNVIQALIFKQYLWFFQHPKCLINP